MLTQKKQHKKRWNMCVGDMVSAVEWKPHSWPPGVYEMQSALVASRQLYLLITQDRKYFWIRDNKGTFMKPIPRDALNTYANTYKVIELYEETA